ncbi:hypothetical protein N657DRAFT_643604 [Parathielavia appendiculata]|uniref:Uncharacterized protein n=1 Tax=Parathielavia appendiculata TaxID=2587402 RepID=A0AAN6U1V1_9PEZI|nr:hypothetical protein N657DRAFT_643604 [Parathielavia appendiculata]
MPTVVKPDPLTTRSGRTHKYEQFAISPLQALHCISSTHYISLLVHGTAIRRSHFSFPNNEIGSVVPNKNGFTHTVIQAWQQDLHLKLRPDDVWLAILTQFSFFVNGNADALRPIFVAHEGRVEVVVDARPDTIETVDVGSVAQELASMVKQRLKDPNIATALLPKFTTTTPLDQTTAAIVFLGAVKEYFGYGARLGCSFPSVTLLGERSDWADMLQRVAWFSTIEHEEIVAWALRLTKVLEYMVASFDRPDDPDVKQFWMRAIHQAGSAGSGGAVTTLSGWLAAFCWWNSDGKRVKHYSDQDFDRLCRLGIFSGGGKGYQRLTLDGLEFPVIERSEIPAGVVSVPITCYQAGLDPVKSTLLAGLMGMQVVVEDDDETAVQPASGWWWITRVAV